MLVKDIKIDSPLVYKTLQVIVEMDDTGAIVDSRELPNTYKNTSMREFLKDFNDWLGQFDNKSTGDIICPQDFEDYLGWSNENWTDYNSRNEWEDIYSQDDGIEAFTSSESFVIEVIEIKYHGEIYSDFLVDCINGDIPIFSGAMPA